MARPRKGFRDPDSVKSVLLRMGDKYVRALDSLCEANQRSRREIVETLVMEAQLELKDDPNARINPI